MTQIQQVSLHGWWRFSCDKLLEDGDQDFFGEIAEIRNQDEQVMGSGTSWDKQHLSLTQLTSTDSMAATPWPTGINNSRSVGFCNLCGWGFALTYVLFGFFCHLYFSKIKARDWNISLKQLTSANLTSCRSVFAVCLRCQARVIKQKLFVSKDIVPVDTPLRVVTRYSPVTPSCMSGRFPWARLIGGGAPKGWYLWTLRTMSFGFLLLLYGYWWLLNDEHSRRHWVFDLVNRSTEHCRPVQIRVIWSSCFNTEEPWRDSECCLLPLLP